MTLEQRLARIEKMLEQVVRLTPEKPKPFLWEREVIEQYDVSRDWLKRLRRGYTNKGIYHAPVLFKWSSQNGRHLQYDKEELDTVLKRIQPALQS